MAKEESGTDLVLRYQKYGYYQADMMNMVIELNQKLDKVIQLLEKATSE